MAKEKVNYQEVYDLYQLCSETKDLREFCADYGVNYDKFMNWQRHQLWSEKLGKTVQVEQPKVAKVRITGKPCNSPTVKLEVKQPEGESPIKWVKLRQKRRECDKTETSGKIEAPVVVKPELISKKASMR